MQARPQAFGMQYGIDGRLYFNQKRFIVQLFHNRDLDDSIFAKNNKIPKISDQKAIIL